MKYLTYGLVWFDFVVIVSFHCFKTAVEIEKAEKERSKAEVMKLAEPVKDVNEKLQSGTEKVDEASDAKSGAAEELVTRFEDVVDPTEKLELSVALVFANQVRTTACARLCVCVCTCALSNIAVWDFGNLLILELPMLSLLLSSAAATVDSACCIAVSQFTRELFSQPHFNIVKYLFMFLHSAIDYFLFN
jgi:hypothetical protein